MSDYDTKLFIFGSLLSFDGLANQNIFGFGEEEEVEHFEDASSVDN